MISRCKFCGSICPDFSDICDLCAIIECEDAEIEGSFFGENIEDESF